MTLTSEEPIRKVPVWLARLANRIPGIHWTNDYCVGGCGRPVRTKCVVVLETIDGVPVQGRLCSLGGECEYSFLRDPRDQTGQHYSEIRPLLVEAIQEHRDHFDQIGVSLAFTA